MTLDDLNDLPTEEVRGALGSCCGSKRWVNAMVERLPFRSFDDLLIAADEAFAELDRPDWLEAFAQHPKIGDVRSLRERFPGVAHWAAAEQAGVANSPETVLQELADANRSYEFKFGHIFVVFATGKSAEEMLELLLERLPNDPQTELANAAAEQMKITHLRLHRLLQSAMA
jgi:2-oxo-4-hydroxy-4-carboxy-5-ureidoimidazoline decarboxylase